MADVNISELPDATNVADTDLVEIERPGDPATSLRATVAYFKTAFAALFVSSSTVRTVVLLADQAAYDALDPPDENTLYLVPEEE